MERSLNIIILLLVLALFLGGTVEISEGSKILGLMWLFLALILITISSTRISSTKSLGQNKSTYMLIGVGIVFSDLIYNLASESTFGTLDIMTFLFGASLIALGVNNNDIQRIGIFSVYMSAAFITLFLIFFSMFNRLNIDFTHYFDHYFVLLPVTFILFFLNIPFEIVDTETVRLIGTEELSIVIGGPCSGLYSMFLLIGIIIGYTKLESIETKKIHTMLLVTIIVAYISNIFRVTILYILGYKYGSSVMMFVHTHLGWIIFVLVAGILIYILNRMALHKN